MGPKPRISLERQGMVVACIITREGYKQREIAGKVGCIQRSVSDILRNKLTGSFKDSKIPERKRKTTRREDNILVRKSKVNRLNPPPPPIESKAEMQDEHGVNAYLCFHHKTKIKRSWP